jgi:outer membrane receptor protein involved in Fe transport
VNADPNVQKNGSFGIAGIETGVDFADFLLGIASEYTQGDSRNFYNRNRYIGAFIQDNWRTTRRLTLNYGLRYDP